MKRTLISGAAALFCAAAFAQGTPPAEGGAAPQMHGQAPGPGAGGCPMMGQGMMGRGMMGQGTMGGPGGGMMRGQGHGITRGRGTERYALLDLSDDQRKKVLAIRQEARRKIGDLTRQAANVRDEAHNQIAALLTPEQRSQLRRQGPSGNGGAKP